MLAEFLRSKGDLLLAAIPDSAPEAEGWLQQALEVARELGARMMELRAAISLSRLWRDQGKADEGRRLRQPDPGRSARMNSTKHVGRVEGGQLRS